MRAVWSLWPVRKAGTIAALAIVLSGCTNSGEDSGHGPVFGSPSAETTPLDGSPSASAPMPSPTATSVAGNPTTSPPRPGTTAPSRFATVQPGVQLPTGSQCAAWVRARPKKENKGVNRTYNSATGHHVDASTF